MRSSTPRRRGSHLEVDWVVVSISGLRRWGLVALFVLLAGAAVGGVLYYMHEPVDRRALRTLRHATALREEVRRAGVTESLSGEFDQASRLLDQAHDDCGRKDYPACLARAGDAQRRLELLSGLVNREFVGSGQVIAVQGRVDVQRADQSRWERAREKQTLYNGDFVKTAADASAEVLFSDGTVYRIGPDSLLEVHREARAGSQPSSGEVKLQVGQVNVYTALNQSVVLTDTARAQVDRDSRVGVGVGDDSATTVATYAGTARVTSKRGDEVQLDTRQAVKAAADGSLGRRQLVPDVPVLESPAANTLVNLDQDERVRLSWRPAPGGSSYELEVSRSRLFAPSSLEFPPNRRNSTSATLKVLKTGTFYWRVAALGDEQVRSEWSAPRTFKAFRGRRVEELADTTPPKLEVAKPSQMGNLILVQGVTEAGATVTINGEIVEVAADGTFKKAIALHQAGENTLVIRATDPAGNTSEHRESVYVEVY